MATVQQGMRSWVKSALSPLVRATWPHRVDLPEGLWRLERDPWGFLTLHGARLDALLERYGSPLHVLDVERLDDNAAEFLSAPPGAEAGCEPYFSYKTNPVPAVLARLHARGIGAEVVSEYELWLALKLGVPPERIVFNGPGRSVESLNLAIAQGVLIQLNNREEAPLVAKLAHAQRAKARVGVRVVTPSGWTGQFGEPIASGAALACFHEVQRMPDLNLVAVHCHQGGEIATLAALRQVLEPVVGFLGQLRAELGFNPEIVDLGGSLASPTVTHLTRQELALNRVFGADLLPRAPEDVLTIRSYLTHLVAAIADDARHAGIRCPRIFVEPGRAMTGNAQLLLCRVMNLKAGAAGAPTHAVLDAGINVAEPLRSRYHQIFPVAPAMGRPRAPYRLVGPICTPMDVLYPSWDFPELQRGEALAIMDSGAYFVPFSTSFSYPQPGIVALGRTSERLVRRRETFDDLVRRDLSI